MDITNKGRADADSRKSWKSLLPVVSLKLFLISLLFLAALFTFALIAHEAVFEKEDLFDQRVFHFLSLHTSAGLLKVMTILTFFGSAKFLLPAYLLLVGYFLFTGKTRKSVNIAVIAISSTAMLHLLKRIFERQRPQLPLITALKTYSFPSGHAVSSFIFCMIIAYLVSESRLSLLSKWVAAIFLLLFSISIGLSRIMLRMHYASDVLAGFCLGIVWVVISFALLRWIEKKDASIRRT